MNYGCALLVRVTSNGADTQILTELPCY